MDAVQICVVAGLVVAFGLVSGRLDGTSLTMPMVFVAAGVGFEAIDLVDLALERHTVSLLAEVALALILFSDAARINTGALRRELGLPIRLLGIGLPLTIGLGSLLNAAVLPDLSIWYAALVAAILAPTDAALGQAVVEERSVPQRIRQALNVESGLNDGIALPAVFLFAALSTGEEAEPGFWVRFVVEQIGLGLVIGATVGWFGALALGLADRREWIDGINAQLTTLAFAVLALAGATAAGGNGFIAVFVAGLVFGSSTQRSETSVEYTEDSSRLLSALTFFAFGNLIVPDAVSGLTPAIVVCVVASLTVGRMLPVAIAVASARPDWRTVAFLGWFGPRGIASIVFVLLVVEDAGDSAATEAVLTIVAWTVLGSIVLHGVTAGPLSQAYGRWFESMMDDQVDMPEAAVVSAHRIRFGPQATTPAPDEDLESHHKEPNHG